LNKKQGAIYRPTPHGARFSLCGRWDHRCYVMFCFAMAFDRCLIKDYLLTYLFT